MNELFITAAAYKSGGNIGMKPRWASNSSHTSFSKRIAEDDKAAAKIREQLGKEDSKSVSGKSSNDESIVKEMQKSFDSSKSTIENLHRKFNELLVIQANVDPDRALVLLNNLSL